MKKVLSLLLAVIMAFGVVSVSAFAAEQYVMDANVKKTVQKLQNIDADKDGSYTTGDAAYVLRAAAGIVAESDYSKFDINSDGVVSVADAKDTLSIIARQKSCVTDAELLALFNERVNSVKKVFPGFTKRETIECTSILITTKNAPDKALNVTNLEYDQYVDKIVALMNKFPYNMALNDEMRAELAKMQQAAKDAYKPQTRGLYAGKGPTEANDHYGLYPVGNVMWSSNLTLNDIKDIDYDMSGGRIVITVSMYDDVHIGDEYPTGAQAIPQKIKLPYGKVFNLPEFDESDGSVVNSVELKNGKIELSIDYKTSDTLKAEYSYNYIADVKSAKDPDSDLEMTTKTSAISTEKYMFNRVTV